MFQSFSISLTSIIHTNGFISPNPPAMDICQVILNSMSIVLNLHCIHHILHSYPAISDNETPLISQIAPCWMCTCYGRLLNSLLTWCEMQYLYSEHRVDRQSSLHSFFYKNNFTRTPQVLRASNSNKC